MSLDPNNNNTAKESTLPRNPFSLLPKTIWKRIFQELKSPRDLHACYETCTQWKRLLEHSKTKWIFDQVFPLVFPYLHTRTILNCRVVCRHWRQSVTNFLSDDDDHDAVGYNNRHCKPKPGINNNTTMSLQCKCRECRRQEWTVKLKDNSKVTRFLDKMKDFSSWRNPFVGRSVTVRGTWTLQPFLKRFGAEIWHINVMLLTDTPSKSWILDCLSIIPNWRTFSVSPAFNPFHFKVSRTEITLSCTNITQLEMLMHLPPRPHLEAMSLALNYYHERLLRDPERVAHFQLLSKILERFSGDIENKLKSLTLSLPPQFAIQPPSRSEIARRHNLFSKLPEVKLEHSRVSTLELRNVTTIPFPFLLNFVKTLERINLIYDTVTNDPQSNPVTSIKLGFRTVILSEKLWGKKLSKDEENSVLNSGIWKTLPNLETISITVKISDSGWETRGFSRNIRDEIRGSVRLRKILEGIYEAFLLMLLCLSVAYLWGNNLAIGAAVAYIIPVMGSNGRFERVKRRIISSLNKNVIM